MGGLCIKQNNQTNDPPKQDRRSLQYKDPAKSRVNEQDKAILDIKARMKKLKTYTDKLELQVGQQKEKIQEFLKEKNKQRALIALKHKKFLDKQVEKSLGAQTLLQQTMQNIESAQMDVEVYEALKTGDQVISDLQKQASLEDFEELYEKHQENLDRQKMEQELFGQVLNDEDLEDELAALDVQIMEEALPDAGTGALNESENAYSKQSQQEEYLQPQKQRQMQPQLA
ncbi:charged multivesicular body protein 6 [Stylonychia lemnae]|uniref:Charged multivesicular body protein 6 n=1 Tax=Stylonychia lemnae TaxID=5949 RepID=A0A078AKJ4_STYLE|nr:charged multivesicular body protein 6 [Stylonychia lemnae]|eukprot:CDW81348.1 charged multivesicular body protein 6 [Stylonychia lemnae]